MKILIVEDEILIQRSLKILLEKRNATVTTTGNGKEAIKLIHENEYDRIVCDLMLQDISGFDVIEESKIKYNLEQISNKFLIITAYSSDQVIQRAQSYKCNLINKPFNDINTALESILDI